MPDELEANLLREALLQYLREDIGFGDLTTESIIPSNLFAEATITSKSDGVVAGVRESQILFQTADVKVAESLDDGTEVRKDQVIMKLKGRVRSILTVERTVLNILMRMSGIASLTRKLIDDARSVNPKIRIASTRKTTPGFRFFEKRAVGIGGGDSHRLRLDDLVLIKSNHITAIGGVEEAIRKAKAFTSFTKKIEVEAVSLDQAITAAKCRADIIMLDNMTPNEVEKVVVTLNAMGLKAGTLLEVSGGVTPDTLKTYAKTGVDVISMGLLTHSAKALDINLKISKTWKE
ncbi:MAG: carboxylating nicotinate-nucleotide diphosphorylase [Promethearchaeati archaeon SRVP18_Atabeyarchaeia-1]